MEKNTKRKESTKFITDWFVDNPGQNRGTPATDSRINFATPFCMKKNRLRRD